MSAHTTVAIIGTGFSGMGAAIELARQGLDDFVLLEKADDIGGTWRDNQYPGACCDVPSVLYSFSYEPNPNWSRRFASAPEIHAYQRHVMAKYGLAARTRTGFEVATAERVEDRWRLTSVAGETLSARFVISAVGALHLPHKPALPGLDEFAGKVMHSAEWDRGYDVTGKRIAVVGSAASAVQIVPAVAEQARHVTVLQRTANHLVPRRDRAFPPWARRLFRAWPLTQRLLRWWQYGYNDFLFHPTFRTRDSLLKRYVRRLVAQHMGRVRDPELRARITPDHELGCKRILLSDDYLPALERDDVDLVTDPIDRFDRGGLLTSRGQHIDVDLVVLATGFQTMKLFGDMVVTGPDGRTIGEAWAGGIEAHRTVALAGFPDLFMMYGPGSNLGHSSILIMIEAQAKLVARLIREALRRGAAIEPTPEAQRAWNAGLQAALQERVWATSCASWYKDAEGRIFSLWPHSTTRFVRALKRTPLDEFSFRRLAGAEI